MSGVPQPKPSPYYFAKEAKRSTRRAHERIEKLTIRRRDGFKCRWPHCQYRRARLEVAHIKAAGMGGDPAGVRMQRSNLMLLCLLHHRGHTSLHSGDLRIKPLTNAGTDGPCAFYHNQYIALERAIGVLEPHQYV